MLVLTEELLYTEMHIPVDGRKSSDCYNDIATGDADGRMKTLPPEALASGRKRRDAFAPRRVCGFAAFYGGRWCRPGHTSQYTMTVP
jgi:hypothetical protein